MKKERKKSDDYEPTIYDKLCNLALYLVWGILLLFVVLFLCSTKGHCASEQDYFPMYQNNNGKFSDDLKQEIANRFDSTNNYVFVKFDNFNPNSGYGRYNYHVLYFPKNTNGMFYGEKYINLYQFSLYMSGSFTYTQGTFWCDARQPNTIASVSTNNQTSIVQWMIGDYSSNYDSSTDYVSNFQIMTNNTSSAQIVLLYDDGVSIPDGNTARDDMEKPDINDYIPSWNNPPTFDNSSVESALNSVYDGIVWLGNNIKGTITGSAEFVADTVRWGIQKVIDTIRSIKDGIVEKVTEVKNAILTAVDKIQIAVNKIQDTIDYISQPFDADAVETALENLQIVDDYDRCGQLIDDAFGFFDEISEPNTFTIPVDLTHISLLHQDRIFYLDLGWLNSCKGLIRAFMWTCTTFGLLYTVIDSIPDYIQGQDE